MGRFPSLLQEARRIARKYCPRRTAPDIDVGIRVARIDETVRIDFA